MPDTIRCPDCGQENPADADACVRCNFPLGEHPLTEADREDVASVPGAPVTAAPTAPPAGGPALGTTEIPRLRIARPRRPRPPSNVPFSLWLGVGGFIALLLVFIAIQAIMQREEPPVEGSSPAQQERADVYRTALAKDSTDVEARLGLANVLFDTGNWTEAVVQYQRVVAQDSTRVPAIVDLGVCYYNLSKPAEAERMFRLALKRDPHHPFALFNLGIIHERRDELNEALQYYHRALESAPPEDMRPAIIEAMQRVQKQTGRAAPPLDSLH